MVTAEPGANKDVVRSKFGHMGGNLEGKVAKIVLIFGIVVVINLRNWKRRGCHWEDLYGRMTRGQPGSRKIIFAVVALRETYSARKLLVGIWE